MGGLTATSQSPRVAPLEYPNRTRNVLNHWMRKSAITEGIVTGAQQLALCGEVFTPAARGHGSASDARAPICERCTTIYARLEGATR